MAGASVRTGEQWEAWPGLARAGSLRFPKVPYGRSVGNEVGGQAVVSRRCPVLGHTQGAGL